MKDGCEAPLVFSKMPNVERITNKHAEVRCGIWLQYTLEYYLKLAEQLVDHGIHTLAIKDMAGAALLSCLCYPTAWPSDQGWSDSLGSFPRRCQRGVADSHPY